MLRKPGKSVIGIAALAALLVPISPARAGASDSTSTVQSTQGPMQQPVEGGGGFPPSAAGPGNGGGSGVHTSATATNVSTSTIDPKTSTTAASGIVLALEGFGQLLHKTVTSASTRTQTHAGTTGDSSHGAISVETFGHASVGTVDDISVAQKAADLDRTGTRSFYGGVERVAIGIALVSQAGQDQAEGASPEEVKPARDDGLQAIAQGNHDINTGHAAVAQANKIIESQNNLANVGVATGLSRHELAYDHAKAPESTAKALDTMEKVAGVPAASLIEAVNHNDTDQVISLAAGATGVGMAPEQMAGIIPTFAPSSAPGASGPSTPVFTGVTGGDRGLGLQPSISGSASDHVRKPEALHRITASAAGDKPRHGFNGKEESLEPLNTEQFFGSLGGPAPVAGNEFGDPGDSLFHRVHGQYSKRRSDLLVKAASPAR